MIFSITFIYCCFSGVFLLLKKCFSKCEAQKKMLPIACAGVYKHDEENIYALNEDEDMECIE